MATYLEICQAVRSQAGIAGTGPSDVTGQTGVNADIVRWVDEAYNEIQTLNENWSFLWTQESFILPATNDSYTVHDTFTLRQVSDDSWIASVGSDKWRLRPMSWVAWKNSGYNLQTKEGKPMYAVEKPDGSYGFYPTPTVDTTITLEGYAVPDVMTVSTDIPIMPTQFHELIKLRALLKYTEFYSAPELVQTIIPVFNELLKSLRFSQLPKNNIHLPTFI